MRRATRHTAPILTALLLAIAGVTFVAAPAQANIGTEYHGGFWYTDTDNFTVAVSAVEPSVTGGNPIIPTSVVMSDGNVYTVTSIADHGMKNRGLTSVTIPASVTALGPNAIDSNPGLTLVRFLGNAPTTISDGGTPGESLDTSSGALRVYHPSGAGFTSPTWHGYTTVTQVVAPNITALQSSTFGCGGTVAIQLSADITETGAQVETTCHVELDLRGHALSLRNIIIGTGRTLTIEDTSEGTPGTVTIDPTVASAPQPAGIRTTDATLIINRGTLHIRGGVEGAAIGGGLYQDGGTVVINGGTVVTTSEGAGIGGGVEGDGGTTTITGGSVTATTTGAGAAIGGGDHGNGGSTTITGGTVVASGLHVGAGIGGGDAGTGGTTIISGGTVVASGGFRSAGIGGGDAGTGGTTIISGGSVTATTTGAGAAIGGGFQGDGGSVTIGAGADVTATGQNAVGAGPAGTTFGSLSLAGTLRIPATPLDVPASATVSIAPTGILTGAGGSITGGGTIDNSGSITLSTGSVAGVTVKVHHYPVTFDSDGGSAMPGETVFASTFANGARTLPTPTRTGYTFDGWNTGPGGTGSDFDTTSLLPGPMGDGSPVPVTLYARWEVETISGLAPTITGNAREGQVLTADEGPVTPASTTFTYQWKRYGTPIPGATSKTYKLKAADVGRKLSVTITASSPGQTPQTLTSPLTAFVSSPNKRLILNTSTVKKGQSFNLIATGLKPKQTYIIWLSGKKSYIGFTDANGMVTKSVKFPTSTKQGTRRVRVSGYTNGKRTFTVYTHVKYTQ